MTKIFKENWFKIIIAIPILLQILGILINNLYLSRYDIIDIYPFKMIQIMNGLVFIGFNIFLIFIYSLDTDLYDPRNNQDFFPNTFFKTIFICSMIGLFLLNPTIESVQVGKINLSRNIQLLTLGLSVMFFITRRTYWKVLLSRFESRGIKIVKQILSYIFGGLLFLSHAFLCFNNESYLSISKYIYMFGFGFYLVQKARSLGFRNDNAEESKLVEAGKYNYHINMFFAYFCFLISFIGLVKMYSTYMYIYIPPEWGGVKPTEITIEIDSIEYAGLLIYQNEKSYYLFDEEKITIVGRSEVLTISTTENKQSK